MDRFASSVIDKTARKNLQENLGRGRKRKTKRKMKLTIRRSDNITEAKPRQFSTGKQEGKIKDMVRKSDK